MDGHHLKYPAFVLSGVFLKIRFQSMISFDRKGISKFLSCDITRRNHLPQQLKHTVKEGLALGLKYLSFIKISPKLGNISRCNFVKFNHIVLESMDKMNIQKEYTAFYKTSFVETGRWLIFAWAVLLLAGCSKDEHYNTSHPDKGAVTVTTDWTGRSSDAVLPAEYILRIGSAEQTARSAGSEEQTVSGETNAFKSLFLPGTLSLLVYHHADGITISGTTATVDTLEDGTLNPMPGFLFSAARELDVPKDDTLKVTVPMMQHIRTLWTNPYC